MPKKFILSLARTKNANASKEKAQILHAFAHTSVLASHFTALNAQQEGFQKHSNKG